MPVGVERSFGWLNRFRRLARDYERLPETLAGLHFVVFTILMLGNAATILQRSQHALSFFESALVRAVWSLWTIDSSTT